MEKMKDYREGNKTMGDKPRFLLGVNMNFLTK